MSRALGVCYVAVDVQIPSARGSSTHVVEVAKNLQELGASVVVLSRRGGTSQRAAENYRGLLLHRVYRGIIGPLSHNRKYGPIKDESSSLIASVYRWYLSTILALYCGMIAANLIREHKLTVVLERETSYGAGAVASFLTGRPLVLEVNGPRFSPISASRASVITAYSYSMIGHALRNKTLIVDSGVDTNLFKPDADARAVVRARYGIENDPVVGYVGTFQPWHGVDGLIEASKEVLLAYPQTKFLMVGPGFERFSLIAKRLGVDRSFIFTGPVPYEQVPQYINAADILTSPTNPARSDWTRKYGPPTQIKVFEYMACRKPVVTTSVGPIQRVVKDGVTGLTVPPGDTKALAASICRLIGERELGKKIADQSYQLVTDKYSWASHAKVVYSVLKATPTERAPGGTRVETVVVGKR